MPDAKTLSRLKSSISNVLTIAAATSKEDMKANP
jgi:hypothetical protein